MYDRKKTNMYMYKMLTHTYTRQDTGSWDEVLEDTSDKQSSTQVAVKGEKKRKRTGKEIAKEWSIKILVIFLMCMLSFGSYYVYDNPAALTRTLTDVSVNFDLQCTVNLQYKRVCLLNKLCWIFFVG